VEQLSDQLGKQLWLVLGRSLNIVRKEPQVTTVLKSANYFYCDKIFQTYREKQFKWVCKVVVYMLSLGLFS
jgi:hypothetical protein